MGTLVKIIIGIIIGVAVVYCWPIILGLASLVTTVVAALLYGAGQFLLAILAIMFFCWLSYHIFKAMFK